MNLSPLPGSRIVERGPLWMNDKLPSRVKPRDFHWFLLFVKLTRVQRTRPQPFVSLMEF